MRKKHLFMLPCVAAVAVAAAFGMKTLRSNAYETSSLLMQNVEALSAEENGDDKWKDCPITKYVRNAREGWVTTPVSVDAHGGFYIYVAGRKITLGAQAGIHGKVQIPDCLDKEDNCCDKSHMDKSPKYL